MTIPNITLNNTFDEWRTATNQMITFVNEVDAQQLINVASNSSPLSVSPFGVKRNDTLYLTLNVSSDVLDTSTLNVATANAVNVVFQSLANTDARLILVSNGANTINAVANAGIIQANTARDQGNTARIHANSAFEKANAAYVIADAASGNIGPIIASNEAGFLQANLGFNQANTARIHANTAHSTANAGLSQANTARDHANAVYSFANSAHSAANASFASANAGLSQANTARDHANTAHASANAGLLQANVARVHANASYITANLAFIHANQAFAQANAALPNTSGVAFAGNLQIPNGNLTLGDATTRGIRLSVNAYVSAANVIPQIEALNGSQSIKVNANTSGGAWNDLMSTRDLSIIFSRGSSDDSANLIIGPWTDSSFGYKQDGFGRHGFNTINPRHVIDANGSANISGSMFVGGAIISGSLSLVPAIGAAFAKANTIGTLGTQSSSSVSITGGSISNATVTGGSISGITDLAVADGGTGSSTAAGARSNLGLGSSAVYNIGTSGGNVPLLDGINTWSGRQTLSGGVTSGFTVAAEGGTEGGQFQLARPSTGTSLAGDVVIDIAGNFFRIYEAGGSYRGAVLPITNMGSQSTIDAFPAGTVMLFQQTSAPTGWTKLTTHDNKALRVVSGSVGSGGSINFTTAFSNRGASGTTSSTGVSGTTGATGVAATTDFTQVTGSVNYTTLSYNEMPYHRHRTINVRGSTGDLAAGNAGFGNAPEKSNMPSVNNFFNINQGYSSYEGASWGHTHGFTGDSHQHYFDAGAHSHSFNAGSHTHTFSTSIDMTVQYVDIILASKN